ncbi:MAG: YcgL domain-containing protein [Pseudomonadales bacterium]
MFRSEKMELAYLYVPQGSDLKSLPGDLLKSFGEPGFVLDLELDESRKLALANPRDVLDSINEHGFYLQMPPPANHVVRTL